MSVGGFILLHRGTVDHPALRSAREPLCRVGAWVWLLENAAWKDTRIDIHGQTVVVRRGQLCRSYRSIADAWGWSVGSVQRFFGRLKTDTMIDTAADTGRVIITICNYDRYQTPARPGDTPPDTVGDTGAIHGRYAGDTQKKEGKEDNNSSPSPDGEGVSSAGAADAPGAASSDDPPAAPSSPQPGAKVSRQRPEIPEATLLALGAIWNDMAADIGLPQVSELTPKRRAALRARIVERWMKDPERQFRKYCRRISTSDFLTGQKPGSDWKASFDWAIKPGSPVAVAEGKYHDGEAG